MKNRILLLLLSVIICIATIAENRTLYTSKDGFKYYLIDIVNDNHYTNTVKIVSLIGDTILSTSGYTYQTHIDFKSDPVFGGYFIIGYNKIIDLNGKTILSLPNSYPSLISEKNNKAYFIISLPKGSHAFYDLEGNFILKFKKDYPQYDESRNEFYILKKNRKRKYLKVGLPNLDYAAIAERNKQIIKKSMENDGKVTITDKEIDGFYFKEVRKGEHVGILNFRGDTIIPLSRQYSVAEFISMNNGLGCFRVQKGRHIGISDLQGNLIIPFSDEIDQITFDSGKREYSNTSTQEIPGFFLLEKGMYKEARDINGEVIIPFKECFKTLRFIPVKNHIGYFEGWLSYFNQNNHLIQTRKIYDMGGEPLFNDYEDNFIWYDQDLGFVIKKNDKIKSKTDILLSKDGIGDYSLIEQKRAERARKEAEKEEKRRRRAAFWGNLASAFAQSLVQTAQVGLMYSQAVNYNMASSNVPNQNIQTGSLASQLENPQYLNQTFNQILNYSIAQVQYQELQEYNQARQAFQQMGKDLSLAEFRAMQGQAIQNLKEQGVDIIAEQNAANREMREFNRSQMNSGKENVERIKQQNAAKYGGTYSSSTSNYMESISTKQSSNSTSNNTSIVYNTSTTNSSTNTTVDNSGSVNAYRYIQRKVNLHGNPNSNSSVVFQNCEVYQKGSQYYVKIGEQYYQIQHCNKQFYNRTITYGAHPYYFNM